MKALVSGPHSFLASHVATALQNRGVEVVPIHRSVFQNFRLLQNLFREEQPDYIINMASYGNHGMQQDHEMIIEANLLGTHRMLQASWDIDYRAFVQIGTSSEYGHKDEPMMETDSLDADTFYATTKIGATMLCRAYASQFKKPIVVARPFSVFGTLEADWRFIPTVVRSLVTDTPMSFNPTPTHDWIGSDSFASAIMIILDHIDEVSGGVVNIGTGTMRSNLEVLQKIEEVFGKKVLVKNDYIEPPHHSSVWVADNSKLKALGWKEASSFDDFLKQTVAYYKQKYDKE